MAQRSSSGRGATATKTRGNQTPNTPDIRESDIAQLRVDEIRGQLQKRGISGISGQRKGELVKTLVKTMRAEQKGAPAKKRVSAKGAAKKAPVAAKKAPAGGKKTVTAGAKKAAAPARKTTAKAAAPARKTTTAKKTTAGAKKGTATAGAARPGGTSSRSLKYAQRISSPEERPSRPGRSLVTTDHEVIRRWAQARNATPATVPGTEYDGRPGVLRFDFPGFGGGRLREISWSDWFNTFDTRQLNFIYQENTTDGRQSNFFVLESPHREDA